MKALKEGRRFSHSKELYLAGTLSQKKGKLYYDSYGEFGKVLESIFNIPMYENTQKAIESITNEDYLTLYFDENTPPNIEGLNRYLNLKLKP